MLNISQLLATELKLKPHQVQNALELLAEGATIPFIARYRKERTDEMDEVQLRDLQDRHNYLTELEERKKVIGLKRKIIDLLNSATAKSYKFSLR
jgi:uncharacterized protein